MTSITFDQIFNELQMLNVKQLTGDSRDQSERTKDSECSQSFHVKTTALFSYRSLHSAEVVDGIHGNGEQTEEEGIVRVRNITNVMVQPALGQHSS